MSLSFFFQAEDGIRDGHVTGVQTCALPILSRWPNLRILARAGIFQGVQPSAVAALTKQLQPVDFPRGHTVFAEGEPGDRLRSEERRVGKEGRAGRSP